MTQINQESGLMALLTLGISLFCCILAAIGALPLGPLLSPYLGNVDTCIETRNLDFGGNPSSTAGAVA